MHTSFFLCNSRLRVLLRASGSTGRHPPPAHPGKVNPLRTSYLPLTLQPYTILGAPEGLGIGRPDTPPRERLRGDRDPWAPNPVHPKKTYALCTDQRHVLPRLLPLIRHNTVIGLKVERNPLPYHVPRVSRGRGLWGGSVCYKSMPLRLSDYSAHKLPQFPPSPQARWAGPHRSRCRERRPHCLSD